MSIPPHPAFERQRLLATFATKAYLKKQITLASGRVSDFYIDCKQVFMRQEGLVACAEALLAKILAMRDDQYPVTYVAGSGVGGGPLATAVMMRSVRHPTRDPIRLLYVRDAVKDHGTMRQVEPGDSPIVGMSTFLVEDVITTGGSALRAARHLVDAGYGVVGVIALVDREEGGAENIRSHGFEVDSVFTKTDILEYAKGELR